MSSDDNNNPPQDPSPPSPQNRRPSFTELFASRPPTQRPQPSAMSAAITQSAQEAASRTRRLSITTLGLSGSPTQQTSPFGNLRRNGRTSGGDGDESAIDEGDSVPPMASGGERSPPLRRMSFGARAYAGQRSASLSYPSGAGPGTAGTPGIAVAGSASNGGTAVTPPGLKKDGFNFSENLRTRAERASISGQGGGIANGGTFGGHTRSRSQHEAPGIAAAAAPAPPVVAVPKPKPKPKQNAPDHFQERILKGDFYMD